ncbi:MAG TPA: hypothetical protein VHK01_02705 [Lacipirellulaceae bacterium]|nr:hypothetical protein [Lacipirellulaceae bacterium]
MRGLTIRALAWSTALTGSFICTTSSQSALVIEPVFNRVAGGAGG